MSGIIHMDTDQVRLASQQIKQLAREIEELTLSAYSAIQRVDWQGSDRDAYLVVLKPIITRIQGLSQAAVALGQRAEVEVDEWELADQRSTAFWKETLGIVPAAVLVVPVLSSLPETGSVLGENMSVDEVDQYLADRANNVPTVSENNQYYQEALKRVGGQDTKKGEGSAHYNWRIAREIEYLRWYHSYDWHTNTPLDGIGDIGRFLDNLINEKWETRRKEWELKYPEPEYGS